MINLDEYRDILEEVAGKYGVYKKLGNVAGNTSGYKVYVLSEMSKYLLRELILYRSIIRTADEKEIGKIQGERTTRLLDSKSESELGLHLIEIARKYRERKALGFDKPKPNYRGDSGIHIIETQKDINGHYICKIKKEQLNNKNEAEAGEKKRLEQTPCRVTPARLQQNITKLLERKSGDADKNLYAKRKNKKGGK